MAQRAFRRVVINRQAAVAGVAAQGVPLVTGVVDRRGQRALGKHSF